MAGNDQAFPAAKANAFEEFNLNKPDEFPVDSVSSDTATSNKNKEAEATVKASTRTRGAAEAEKSDLTGALTSVLMISGMVIAAVGVAFFVTKKLKET